MGFLMVEVAPFPKFQNQADADGVVKSIKFIGVFAQALTGVAEKFAFGLSLTIIHMVIPALSLQPPAVVITRDMG